MGKLIGRVLATEKCPTTMDKFCFWTDQDLRLAAFDVIKVEHISGSFTFGVVENISHITDAQSFLTNYISSDFGDVNIEEPTLRVGMNYVEAKVSFNDSNWYTPVHNNAKVYLATKEEITFALGLRGIKNPLVCGSLKMYEGTQDEVNLPVHLNSKFILGPEGAHLNISGISGLASKTSYAMFLMKAIQDQHINDADENDDDSVAFVIFNVKGNDLMAIDQANEFLDEEDGSREKVLAEYNVLGLSTEPFKHVRYFIPYSDEKRAKRSTYLDRDEEESYVRRGCLKKYKFIYGEDKESIEMMFANIDDTTMTMDSIISKVLDRDDSDFKGIETWGEFEDKLAELRAGGGKKDGSITVQSWKKFSRVFHKAIQDDMFANRVNYERDECRLAEELKKIGNNDVYVIDVAKLGEDKQAFVFGDVIRTIYNLKLGEFDDEDGVKPPARIVIFIDELNKYASKDSPKTSPIMRQILDVTERGRSLGVILFAAEQFRSNINDRVTGNCATHAYGRTNSIETETKDYKSLPSTYRNMLTRLEQGDYLIQNPVFRTLLKIRFPKPIYRQFKQ